MNESADLTSRMIEAAIDHWPLVAAILVSGYWIFPKQLKTSLLNGAGDIIRGIVRSENASQSVLHKDELDKRLREHERVEKERFDQNEVRFRDIEGEIKELNEVTGSRRIRSRRTK